MTEHYKPPTSGFDTKTGDMIIRIPASTIVSLTTRNWDCLKNEEIRLVDSVTLCFDVCTQIHAMGEDGNFTGIEELIGAAGCAVLAEKSEIYRVGPEPTGRVYFGDWSLAGERQMMEDFRIGPHELSGVEVLIATYTYADYSGSAHVLFRQGCSLMEVTGSHCSCMGLEDQWKPEDTSVAAIRQYLTGSRYRGDLKPIVHDLQAVIDRLTADGIE